MFDILGCYILNRPRIGHILRSQSLSSTVCKHGNLPIRRVMPRVLLCFSWLHWMFVGVPVCDGDRWRRACQYRVTPRSSQSIRRTLLFRFFILFCIFYYLYVCLYFSIKISIFMFFARVYCHFQRILPKWNSLQLHICCFEIFGRWKLENFR